MAVARSMQEREFILSCDKELASDKQTKFIVRPLSTLDQIAISDLVTKGEGMYSEITFDIEGKDGKPNEKRTHRAPVPANYFEREQETLVRCLVGWSNYKKESGEELDSKTIDAKERPNWLYPEWRAELYAFIESLNYPSEAEIKN